jgi:hypothetical protein
VDFHNHSIRINCPFRRSLQDLETATARGAIKTVRKWEGEEADDYSFAYRQVANMRDTAAKEAAQTRLLHLDALVGELMLEKHLLKQAHKVFFVLLLKLLSFPSFPLFSFTLFPFSSANGLHTYTYYYT